MAEVPSQIQKTRYELRRSVFFIGFMGAGKTSVARRIARKCHVSSVDMDTYLERQEGRRVRDIFAESGEDAFRRLESDVLETLSCKEPLLISCGGGIVKSAENRALLRERGLVIYLKVSADEAASRISDTTSRPMFQNVENARKTIEERLPLYEEAAHVSVDTAGKTIGRIASEVQSILIEEGILCPLQK